jgi:hypothetical protein
MSLGSGAWLPMGSGNFKETTWGYEVTMVAWEI